MRCWKGKYITRADYHVYTEICTSNLNGKKPTMIRLTQELIRQRLCRENTSDSITNICLDSGFESQIVIGAWEKYPASFLAFFASWFIYYASWYYSYGHIKKYTIKQKKIHKIFIYAVDSAVNNSRVGCEIR